MSVVLREQTSALQPKHLGMQSQWSWHVFRRAPPDNSPPKSEKDLQLQDHPGRIVPERNGLMVR